MADEKKATGDEKKSSSGIDVGKVTGPPIVQSTTEVVASEASETPMPNVIETDTEKPPNHTGKPDVPIAQTLAAGAGQHTPPDPKVFDKHGRPREVSGISQKDEGK